MVAIFPLGKFTELAPALPFFPRPPMSTGKRKHATPPSRRQLPASQSRFVECPCCPALVPIALINEHLDQHQHETELHSEASMATTPAPAVVNTPTPKGVGAAAARVTVAAYTPASATAPPSLSLQSTASSSSRASSARLPLQPSPATAALSQTPLGRAFAASSSVAAPSRDTASPQLGLSPVGPLPPPALAPHSCFLPAYVNRLGDHVYPGAGRNELGPALHDTRRVNAWLVRSAWLQQRAGPAGGGTLGRVLELAGEIGQAAGSGEGALLDAAERELVAAAAAVGAVARQLLGHAFEASGGWCRLQALPPPEAHAEAHAEGASQEGGGGGGGGGGGDGGGGDGGGGDGGGGDRERGRWYRLDGTHMGDGWRPPRDGRGAAGRAWHRRECGRWWWRDTAHGGGRERPT